MNVGNKENLVRFSFVSVFEPKSVDGSEPKYSVQVLIPKKHDSIIKAVEQAIADAVKIGVEKKLFGPKASAHDQFRWCLRDGDKEAEASDDGSKDYLKGHVFFNASCQEKNPPTVVDRYLKPIFNREEFYSGCWGVINCNFFPFKHGKGGVACGLNSIMKREEGERLDNRVTAEQAFADLVDKDEPQDELQ